jgi:hypothetical protein
MDASRWVSKPKGVMKVMDGNLARDAPSTGLEVLMERSESEHACWDPKDGELCLSRVKPEETLVEARSGSDVQIDRQTWV